MICIVCSTNRKNSKTSLVAKAYEKHLRLKTDEQVLYYSLESLPESVFHHKMYEGEYQDPGLGIIQDEIIIPSDKLIFVAPEYNGGIPGVLKLFIDAISVRRYKETFKGKKVCLTGISSGRSGNLRGMEYLTGLLHYLEMDVYHFKLPISSIEKVLAPNNELNKETQKDIEIQLDGFLKY